MCSPASLCFETFPFQKSRSLPWSAFNTTSIAEVVRKSHTFKLKIRV